MFKRMPTGVPCLDSLMEGGFIENSVYLVTGATGTGKTIFACQFIWHGLQRGEKCVIISMEESAEEIKSDVARFGWDFEKYEKKGTLKIIYHDPVQVDKLGTTIRNEIQGMDAKRFVLDSTSAMSLAIDNKSLIRRRIASIVSTIKKHDNCTGLIITEIPEGSKKLSRFDVEEFVAEGVVLLNYLGMGMETSRSLQIRKMRRTDHGKDVYPMSITSKGIVIKKGGL